MSQTAKKGLGRSNTVVKIGSNILSLSAQRRLNESSGSFSKTLERLSSGLRINHASDDPAGLSIAMSLSSDVRVFTQAIRNVNDGVSALNIVDGALQAFSSILTRQKELAEQSANQTYSAAQRKALQRESDALTDEYNRIAASVKFNGISLLNPSSGTFSIQLGRNSSDTLQLEIGSELYRDVFSDSFAAGQSTATGGGIGARHTFADFNGDGKADLVYYDSNNQTINTSLGNGDGTFMAASASIGLSAASNILKVIDLNNDGKNDLISLTSGAQINVFLGNGDGSFATSTTYSTTNTQNNHIIFGDFNNDGNIDAATSYQGKSNSESINVLYGNGNGTLQNGVKITATNSIYGVRVGDFNGDGIDDLLGVTDTSGSYVFLGSRSGSFSQISSGLPGSSSQATLGDFNRDGFDDVVLNGKFYSGNGNGTFQAGISVPLVTSMEDGPTDINGDGYLDLYVASVGYLLFSYGNGDGTFQSSISVGTGSSSIFSPLLADINADGVLDYTSGFSGTDYVNIAQTNKTASIPHFNISSTSEARSSLTLIDTAMKSVLAEIGIVGSHQSRLESAINTLSVTRHAYQTAHSRIVDVDIAQESAELVKTQIRQKAAAAILTQANQQPALALRLLKN